MQVRFTDKSETMGEKEREYVQRKLDRLARHFRSAREAHVTHTHQRGRATLEVQLDLNGPILRAEERSQRLEAAADAVVDKLEQQIRRAKEKWRGHKGRVDAPKFVSVLDLEGESDALGASEGTDASETLPRIVRTKRFSVHPMSVDEASLQLELLDHNFFVFLNADSGELNVLYRRRDGGYGLLQVDA